MKKFLFCLSLTFCFQTFSQVSDTLLPNYFAFWDVKIWHLSITDYNGYYLDEDYSINGELDLDGEIWTFFTAQGVDGLMRSDSGIVYCRGWFNELPFPYSPPDTTEKILYDFTMEIGDTAYYDQSSAITVESIGTSNILGVPKKAWFLSNNDTIVQGLGSTKGLFRPWKTTFENNHWICSFNGNYKDSAGTVTNLSFTTDACLLNIDAVQNEAPNANIHQNQIIINSEEQRNLVIYSIEGKQVYSAQISSGQTIINNDFLEGGLYILKIGSSYEQKFFRY